MNGPRWSVRGDTVARAPHDAGSLMRVRKRVIKFPWIRAVSTRTTPKAQPLLKVVPERPAQRAVAVAKPRRGAMAVSFGDVSVVVAKPSAATVEQGVKASARVIASLGRRLLEPGLTITHGSDVPVFTADPANPQRVVCQLNGKTESGRFVRGKFKPEPKRN